MKKLLLGTVIVASLMVIPLSVMAQVSISVNIGLPPAVVFAAPPQVIVLPDTDDVYVVPDIGIDLFFWNGWWWRPWEGRWYRSRYYDRGWVHYRQTPRFYYDVDPSWRAYYRDRDWRGYRWDYERIPDQRLRQNWNSWRSNGYWQRQRAWDVKAYRPLPAKQRRDLRNWRQEQTHQRPDIRQHEQQRQQQHRQPQAQQQRGQGKRPQAQQLQHSPPRGRPQGGEGERRR